MRPAFAGIELADSFIVDPHKWLFAPYDCCALLYRDPGQARAAHSQSAAYLDAITARNEWNPADYAVHLSRRARGLPFWFSLAVHGTDAYAEAIETTLAVTRQVAEEIRARPYLELLIEPELSVLVFRRRGWTAADYDDWSARLFATGTAFVMPTRVAGRTGGPDRDPQSANHGGRRRNGARRDELSRRAIRPTVVLNTWRSIRSD